MKCPLLYRLRRETSSLHQAPEADLNLLSPELTIWEYRMLPERFYGFYAPWEARIERQVDTLLPRFTAERWKVPMLERDLQFLKSDLARIPKCVTLPDYILPYGGFGLTLRRGGSNGHPAPAESVRGRDASGEHSHSLNG